jgi:hypothetical protein
MTLPLDVGGARLSLREAAVTLGHATLRIRAGEPLPAGVLVANALRLIVLAEAELDVIARERRASESGDA